MSDLHIEIDIDLILLKKLAELFKIYIYKLNDFDSHPTSISFINVCSEESQIQFLIPVLKIIQKKIQNHLVILTNIIKLICIL